MNPTRTCTVEWCEKNVRSSGAVYCEMHYMRMRRNGTLETIIPKVPESVCIADGCIRDAFHTDGRCRNHHIRFLKNGDHLLHHTGELSNRWLSDDETNYGAVHQRVRKAKGKARDHKCVDCGGQAKHWSYNHLDPEEKIGVYRGNRMPYSLNMEFYEPRCVKCHKKLDLAEVKRRSEREDAS